MATVTRSRVSFEIAQLMPMIIQGVQLDFFVKRGTTQTQFLVLMAIHGYGRCTMGMLAKRMQVSMPTATGIISRLVRNGLVRRFPHPKDRRQVIVELTAKGQAFIRAFQGVIRLRWEEVLKSLQPRELEAFYHVLTTLRQQLRQ